MFDEPWMGDAVRQARWDRHLAALPVCRDCREPITEELCLPVEDGGVICPRCVRGRMVEVNGEP